MERTILDSLKQSIEKLSREKRAEFSLARLIQSKARVPTDIGLSLLVQASNHTSIMTKPKYSFVTYHSNEVKNRMN